MAETKSKNDVAEERVDGAVVKVEFTTKIYTEEDAAFSNNDAVVAKIYAYE